MPTDGNPLKAIDPMSPHLESEDDSVGVIYATDVLQQVGDGSTFLDECHRVLTHGGMLITRTSEYGSTGLHQGTLNSESTIRQAIELRRPGSRRLQLSHLRRYYPSAWHRQHRVPYIHANVLAIKDGPRQGGPLPA